MYDRCPYKFKLLVLQGRKDLVQPPSAALALGTSVHKALQEIFLLSPPDRTEQRLLELLKASFLREFRGIDRDEMQQMWDRGKKAMRLFVQHEDMEADALFLEEILFVNLPDFTVSGKLDRGHRDPDGKHHIVDYKTGKQLPDQMQLQIYSILGSDHLSVDELRVSYLYVEREGNDRWITYEVGESEIEAAIESVTDQVARISADKNYPALTGPLCDWCQCLPVCDAGKTYLANTPSESDLAFD